MRNLVLVVLVVGALAAIVANVSLISPSKGVVGTATMLSSEAENSKPKTDDERYEEIVASVDEQFGFQRGTPEYQAALETALVEAGLVNPTQRAIDMTIGEISAASDLSEVAQNPEWFADHVRSVLREKGLMSPVNSEEPELDAYAAALHPESAVKEFRELRFADYEQSIYDDYIEEQLAQLTVRAQVWGALQGLLDEYDAVALAEDFDAFEQRCRDELMAREILRADDYINPRELSSEDVDSMVAEREPGEVVELPFSEVASNKLLNDRHNELVEVELQSFFTEIKKQVIAEARAVTRLVDSLLADAVTQAREEFPEEEHLSPAFQARVHELVQQQLQENVEAEAETVASDDTDG